MRAQPRPRTFAAHRASQPDRLQTIGSPHGRANAFAAKRARSLIDLCALCRVLCFNLSEIVPFGASLTSSQLHWIRDHDGRGKLSSGNPGQVKVVEEDLREEEDGDGGEEEGAKVDEGQTVEEGASEQIPTQECKC